MGVGTSSILPKAIVPINSAISGNGGGISSITDGIITEDSLYLFATEQDDFIILE